LENTHGYGIWPADMLPVVSAGALLLCASLIGGLQEGGGISRTGLGFDGADVQQRAALAHVPFDLNPQMLAHYRLPPILRGRQFAEVLPEMEGIKYVAKVSRGLYRGSSPKEEGVQALARLGIRTVISLRGYSKSEQEDVEAAGMRYVSLPLKSTSAPLESQVGRFFDILSDRSAYPIYVHCLHGVDRTGTMIALYRMRHQGWRSNEALAEMVYFGDHGFKKLRRYVATYRA
jgi:protein tyrosine phosphatase (PTP) superfamily phosphohydrolase (DUF442 family)